MREDLLSKEDTIKLTNKQNQLTVVSEGRG